MRIVTEPGQAFAESTMTCIECNAKQSALAYFCNHVELCLACLSAARRLLVKECPDTRTDAKKHAAFSHPDYEYFTREGQRKAFYDQDVPPEWGGWEVNVDAGRDGWERFSYTEEAYWRRRKA